MTIGTGIGYYSAPSVDGKPPSSKDRVGAAGLGLITGFFVGLISTSFFTKTIDVTPSDYGTWLKDYNSQQNYVYRIDRTYSKGRLLLIPVGGQIPSANNPPVVAPKSTIRWQPYSIFDKKVFPSFVISFAEAGSEMKSKNADISNIMGFQIHSDANGKVVFYEIEPVEKDLIEGKAQGRIVLKQGSHEYLVDIPWKYQALRKLKQSTPLKVNFRFREESNPKFESQLVTFDVRNIYDCVLRVEGTNFYEMLAAYVQEQNPLIEGVLKEGKDKGYISAWVGTQGTPTVDEQVEAVWKVLQGRGVIYSSIALGENDKDIFSQQIRTFSQSITNEAANCVDGTLVFCSILRKIGVRTFAIVIEKPGHCMLGYYDETGNPKILETTMIGAGASFNDALEVGSSSFIGYNKTSDNVTLVDIDKMRRAGINSINTE